MSKLQTGSPSLMETAQAIAKYNKENLLDKFAMAALTGFCSRPQEKHWTMEEVANDCYVYAKAMLKERNK